MNISKSSWKPTEIKKQNRTLYSQVPIWPITKSYSDLISLNEFTNKICCNLKWSGDK